MTQEDKDLLIKDLSERLPYGVKGIITHNGDKDIFTLEGVCHVLFLSDTECCALEDFKPYLRPMSSMTEEERKKYEILANRCISTSVGFIHLDAQDLINWLLKNHFDYNCLIPKGLAIEVTEENNPYKE